MAKKLAVLFSVLAFASVSSVAFAGGSCCKDTCGSKGDSKTEIISESSIDCSGGGGSCGGDRGGKKA